MKLLAKTAEERYQTARGVERDLRRCLADWDARCRIAEFPLGEHDTPDRLLIPEKLYGRSREIDSLLAAFDRVAVSGNPELVLLSGYSGIGKSSVVHELHKLLVPTRGLFASGKFDQYKRDIPYATLAQAFRSLVRPLLSKNEAELDSWREAFRQALGPNGLLVVDLVPELKFIIGEQLPVPDLAPHDAQRRFQLVLRRFIAVFARPEHPLLLFLDDLQWLDAATLDVMEDLLRQHDVRHLLLIGAYRDDELGSAHPLMLKLGAIRNAGATVREIFLAPLTRGDLGQLIADSLHCETGRATSLACLVHEKTAGNPFFAIQFVSSLVEAGLLTFDHDNAQWSWDVQAIRAKAYTDNVVGFLVDKMSRLPLETESILQELACLGNRADLALLTEIFGKSTHEMQDDLAEAVREGLVFFSESSLGFLHDRVREAAYSLIDETRRAATHLRIGRLIETKTPPTEIKERIFEILHQLNRGSELITSSEERERLAELNLIAGKRAKSSTAYDSALNYLVTGAALLSGESREARRDLWFELELHQAECEFLTGQPGAAEERLTQLSFRAATRLELASVTSLRVDLYTALDQSDQAVNAFLDYLRHLGVAWSSHPPYEEARLEYDRIWSQLGCRAIEEVIELPLMSDPESLATVDVLTKAVPPAMYRDANLGALAICRAANLSLEHGISDAACFALVYLGMIAGPHFGDYPAGFRFGQLGYDLVEKRGLRRFQARTYMCFGSHVMFWAKHVRSCRDLIHRAFEAATKAGDLTFAAYSRNNVNTNLLAAGDPLGDVQLEVERALAFADKIRFGFVRDIVMGQLGLVRTLRGSTEKLGSFNEREFDELSFERHLTRDPAALPECFYWIRKLQARFLAGDYLSAVDASLKAQRLLWTAPSNFEIAEYHFYGALSRAASWDPASLEEKRPHFEALVAHHKQLVEWAENCPENFANRAALVGAEIARIKGRVLEAEHLYEQAIRSAHANDFVHNEALANELAARFYSARGFSKIAHTYLRDARYCYLHWGADGKVRQLDQLYPRLEEEEPRPAPTSTIMVPVEHMDLATVMKVSQAVSSEIHLEKLIDTLMRTAIEHAGAERGLLILVRGDEYRIEAEASIGGGTVTLRQASVTPTDLPESVLNYVARTKESVLLHDASGENPFSTDEYIHRHQARSILCLPLLKQTRLVGVLYLENSLTVGVFTAARLAVLKLLASQAAISLENVRLYADLQEREAKVRLLVDTALDAVLSIDEQGRITEWNAQAETMFGWRREEAVGLRLSETLIPIQYRSDHETGLRRFLTSGEGPILGRRVEFTALRRNGSEFPIELSVSPFRVGETWAFSGFIRDITEHKRLYSELQEREAKVRRLIDSNIIGIFIWDLDGRIVEANEAFLRIVGYSREDLISRRMSWRELTPAEWHYADDRRIGQLQATGIAQPYEKEYVQKSGKRVPVLVGAANFREGRDEGVAFVVDLTERKEAERAARETERRYREVQMELAHANRVATMGQLSASIAHEINQPIGAVVTNAQAALRWLEAQPADIEEVRQALGRIVRDGNRAANVMDRIRTLVKKAPPRKGRLEINEAIREVIALTHGEAVKNRVSVQTRLSDALPLVQGDQVQLQQVVLNLMINAVEAMSVVEGSRELLISTARGNSHDVLVTVQDSGPGLGAASPERVFEAFYTTKPGGIGIGLSICRSIVDAHGGRLWASASMPKGAIFQFTLPVHSESAP
jgi:PAS domain S-box-containing protein